MTDHPIRLDRHEGMAAQKARHLLQLFAATPVAQDPRRQTLIASVLDDFARPPESDSVQAAKTVC